MKLSYLRSRLGLLVNKIEESQRISDYKTLLPLFSDIIARANERITAWGGKFYFVYLPGLKRFMLNIDQNDYDLIKNRKEVLDIVDSIGIPIIDLYPVFERHPDLLSLSPYKDLSSRSPSKPLHLNARGYKLVAETIINHLRKMGL